MRLINRPLLTLAVALSLGWAIQAQAQQNVQLRSSNLSILNVDGEEQKSIMLRGDQVLDFDVAAYLAENPDAKIDLSGRYSTDQEIVVMEFNSADLSTDNTCTDYCEKVVSIEKLPYIGLRLERLENASGAIVKEVIAGGTAEQAGIELGDIVIQADQESIGTGCDMVKYVKMNEVGQKMTTRIIRDGKEQVVIIPTGFRTKKTITWEACCEPKVAAVAKSGEAGNTVNQSLVSVVEVFPNPSEGIFQVTAEGLQDGMAELLITDIAGRQVIRKQVNVANGSYTENINMSKEAVGMYIVNVNQGEVKKTVKVLVK